VNRDAKTSAGNASAASRLEEESDQTLAAFIGQGDAIAFQILMERHINMHLSFAERMMGNREEAEDIVQDAFSKLWIHAEKFDPSRSKFTTWFYRIVMNRCLDKKRKKTPLSLPENYDAVDQREDPSERLAKKQRERTIRQALNEIPGRQRAAITLCYFEGLSNQEAADILALNIKALESLLCRGRKNLKTLLEGALQGF